MDENVAPESHIIPSGYGIEEPERAELKRLRTELRGLYEMALSLEMKVERLRGQLEAILLERLLRIGPLLAERDDLDARIAEALLAEKPEDPVLGRRAQEARAKATKSMEEAVETAEKGPITKVRATEDLKARYRQAAKKMHPDLGQDPEDHEARHEFMARLNAAFKRCDSSAIEDLIARWDACSEAPVSSDTGQELVRAIRAITRLKMTVERLNNELEQLRSSPEHELMMASSRASATGQDLLGTLEIETRLQIQRKRTQLDDLRNGNTPLS